VEDTLFTEETSLRMKDETSKALIQKLAEGYKESGLGKNGAFFSNEVH
jgi:hypothetical protein